MWFKRANANRRLARGQKLKVKLRSDQESAARAWWFARAITIGLGTVFTLYILWCLGGWGLDKFVYENPTFAIEQVDIQSDGMTPSDQLRRWSGVKPGANLIGLDLAAIKRNLELVSTIDTVSLERILPRTLIIRVTERQPVAQVDELRAQPTGSMAVAVFQLDINGFVIQPADPRQALVPLDQFKTRFPVIAGLKPNDVLPGHQLTNAPVLAALRLIAAFDRSPIAGLVDLQSVDVSAPGVLVATSRVGGEVTFAPAGLEQQLNRWRLAYNLGRSAGKMIASLDLAVGNNVPVKWDLPGADPEAAPKTKPPHLRRKNV